MILQVNFNGCSELHNKWVIAEICNIKAVIFFFLVYNLPLHACLYFSSKLLNLQFRVENICFYRQKLL